MSIQFTNEVISELNLPEIEGSDFEKIEKKYRGLMLFRNSLVFAILLLVSGVAYFIPKIDFGITEHVVYIISILLLWIFSTAMVFIGFPQKAYLIRQKDISYKTGYFFRKLTTVPLNRIQHVELRQSPLARLFGLSKLIIYTAGGSTSDISIPGLFPEKSEEIKLYLTQKISDEDSVQPSKEEEHD